MAYQERKLQTQGVNWLKMALPEVIVIAVINELPQTNGSEEERHANMIRMQICKQMGLYPGCSDLILLWNDGALQIRFLETKDKAPQSVNQEKFQKRVESIGGQYFIWRSMPELETLCRSFGLKPVVAPPAIVPRSKKALMGEMWHQFMLDVSRED